ncbi:MAG: DUF5644 domain-containing protein [Helicobacteraceae bacterium]|jgi:succinate dehydrogenase/fumarate reductase-like Fe-S protein|nr:DUF5644 domain-containing protein [Helicobacteraceae bacterium]
MKVVARVFRFDAKHDYLGALQPFEYRADEGASLIDLLSAFKSANPLCKMRLELLGGARVNGVAARLDSPVSAFARHGGEIVLEPLMPERVTLDLECDPSRFDESFKILADLADKSDRAYYDDFFTVYAASPMRALNPDYYGEALFALASRLIAKDGAKTDEILRRVSHPANGIFAFAGLYGAVLDGAEFIAAEVEKLQELARNYAPTGFKAAKFAKRDLGDLANLGDLGGKAIAVSADLGAFAACGAKEYEQKLAAIGAEVLRLKNAARVTGAAFAHRRDLSIKAACEAVLEAQDLGAEVLFCAAAQTRDFLQSNIKAIKSAANTPIMTEIA